jgi:hypothetical protein
MYIEISKVCILSPLGYDGCPIIIISNNIFIIKAIANQTRKLRHYINLGIRIITEIFPGIFFCGRQRPVGGMAQFEFPTSSVNRKNPTSCPARILPVTITVSKSVELMRHNPSFRMMIFVSSITSVSSSNNNIFIIKAIANQKPKNTNQK